MALFPCLGSPAGVIFVVVGPHCGQLRAVSCVQGAQVLCAGASSAVKGSTLAAQGLMLALQEEVKSSMQESTIVRRVKSCV